MPGLRSRSSWSSTGCSSGRGCLLLILALLWPAQRSGGAPAPGLFERLWRSCGGTIKPVSMNRLPLLAAAAFAGLAFSSAAGARLSREEQSIDRTVTAEAERSVALLERLVNQNSGTLNLAGVRAVGDMLRPEFEQLGFEVRWSEMAETGRAGHLVATHRGNGRGRRILLIGHLDTVFEPDSPFQRFERQGDRATGPGIGDDKGGDVVIVAALRAMQAAGTLRDADIMVVLTGDEERPGSPISVARRDLIEAGRWADVAFEF